jgi:hypothetical protein
VRHRTHDKGVVCLTLVNLSDTLAHFRVGRSAAGRRGEERAVRDGETRDYLSVEEAGRRVEPPVTRQAVHQWIRRGVNGTQLEAFRVGRAYLVSLSALEAFCKATGKTLRK